MKHSHLTLAAAMMMGVLFLAACSDGSDDVASLRSVEDTEHVEGATSEADSLMDNEAMMMALTECMREHGVEVLDPVVDAEGNVDKPEFVEGAGFDKEKLGEAWEVCAEHLEGFTFEQKRVDVSQAVDELVGLASCLRNKGHDMDDPTAETLDQWWTDMKMSMDWTDPETMADYEECSGESPGKGSGK